MLRKIYLIIRTKGVIFFLNVVFRYIFPKRINFWPKCETMLKARKGLEIGGPSKIFSKRGNMPIYEIANSIDNCNFNSRTIWEGNISDGKTFIFNSNKDPGRQHIAEASDLQCIKDSTYDFILSSHCLEHVANPIKALKEWIRVIKTNGTLVLIIPHKDGTFDNRRPVTTLEHLIKDFNNQTNESDLSHLEEILELHDFSRDPGAGSFENFKERSKNNESNRGLHHHVFDTRLAINLVDYVNLKILSVELLNPYHIILIAKKQDKAKKVNNEKFKEKMYHIGKVSG